MQISDMVRQVSQTRPEKCVAEKQKRQYSKLDEVISAHAKTISEMIDAGCPVDDEFVQILERISDRAAQRLVDDGLHGGESAVVDAMARATPRRAPSA